MVQLASNEGVAQTATTGVSTTAKPYSIPVDVGSSRITGMSRGAAVNNEIVPAITAFSDAVQAQAAKFPALARVIASRDQQTKFDAGGGR